MLALDRHRNDNLNLKQFICKIRFIDEQFLQMNCCRFRFSFLCRSVTYFTFCRLNHFFFYCFIFICICFSFIFYHFSSNVLHLCYYFSNRCVTNVMMMMMMMIFVFLLGQFICHSQLFCI